MSLMTAFEIHAGRKAAAQIARDGILPTDIGCVPAAAGGPKGLALIELDRLLFHPHSGWLRSAGAIELVGASIGAWRMAAACQAEPIAALDRLAAAYLAQTYSPKPSARTVAEECRKIARAVLGEARSIQPRAGLALSVLTARARGVLARRSSRSAFARVALSNAVSRARLAAHMERVIFTAGPSRLASSVFDRFGITAVELDSTNSEDALLASGSIPLVCEPVRSPAGAPPGDYWDGGLIDYHLLLPYPRLGKLVLYPHFAPRVTPGWLDKMLPWRKHPRGHEWLSNVVLITPSPGFLARLPNRKLPDRNDFYHYGLDHTRRQHDWHRAMQESERFADEVMNWLIAPDPTLIKPL
jgi:Patatin-like phospholipase